MAYQAIKTACTTVDQLFSEMSSFLTSQAGFTNAGAFTPSVVGDTTMSFRAADGFHYNFEYMPNIGIMMLSMSSAKPTYVTGSKRTMDSTGRSNGYMLNSGDKPYELVPSPTNGIVFPLTARHFFTNRKLVAMVLEVRAGEFIHIVFGKLESFANTTGGQCVLGYNTNRTEYGAKYISYRATTGKSYDTYSVANYGVSDDSSLRTPFVTGTNNSLSYNRTYGAGESNNVLDAQFIRNADDSVVALSYTATQYIFNSNPNSTLGQLLPPAHWGYGSNLYNGRTQIYPYLVYSDLTRVREGGSFGNLTKQKLQPAYYSDMLGYCDVTDLEPETVVNNDWVVFPLSTKSTTMEYVMRTYGFGVAYKK